MTTHADILGRPPARKILPISEPEHESEGDWRGEEHIRSAVFTIPDTCEVKASDDRVRDRRLQVLRMFKAGKTAGEIARRVGVTKRTIFNDARVMGLRFSRQ